MSHQLMPEESRMALPPRKPVPALEFDTVGGERWSLAAQKPQNFTMVVFYRGCTARSATGIRAS